MWEPNEVIIEKALGVIKKYRGNFDLTTPQKKELEEAQKNLDNARKACWHTWDIYIGIVHIEKYCTKCQLLERNHKP